MRPCICERVELKFNNYAFIYDVHYKVNNFRQPNNFSLIYSSYHCNEYPLLLLLLLSLYFIIYILCIIIIIEYITLDNASLFSRFAPSRGLTMLQSLFLITLER